MEAAALHERKGEAGIADAIAALQKLRADDDGDTEALGQLARLHEAMGQVPELAAVLAERARLTDDARSRAALWSRVGELRLGMLQDLDGAAEAYREALDTAPDDPLALSALEAIEERREDWSTLQEVLMRRLGATFGPDQVAVLLKLARNAEQKLSDADQAIGFLRQIIDADPRNGFAFLELERILRANARWYDLVEVLGKHADMEGEAGRKPTELALRVAIADVWEKELDSAESAAEALEKVLEVAPTNVARAAVAGAAARGGRALGRGGRGARARGGERQRPRRDRRDPVPQRADPASGRKPTRWRSSARCCGRSTPIRPTARRWRRWRRSRARPRTTSGWCSSWSWGSR